jgi:SWI/SNF-related matrix-associated actin-dependent regulator of chromatin subfamily A3
VSLRSDVVGIQHYNGMVGPGEKVMLQRDPQNPYDANAVKVSVEAVLLSYERQ